MDKRKLIFILPMLLCLEIPNISIKANQTDKVISYKYLYNETFEKYETDKNWSRQAIYLENSTGIVCAEKNDVISGTKSLKVIGNDVGGWSALKIKPGTVEMKNSSYSLVLECKTNYVEAINIEVKKDYQNGYYAEYGIGLTNDSNGNGAGIYYRKGNLNLEEESIINPVRKIANGVVTLGFDFESLDNLALINICYKANNGQIGTMIVDNIKILDKNNPGTEYKVQYRSDFDEINSTNVFDTTPFWCNYGSMEFENDNGNKSVVYSGNYYMANGDNVALGGLTRNEIETLPNKLYYYSYDIKLTEVHELVLTTLDYCGFGKIYSEITYNSLVGEFKVTAAGGIKDFNVVYEDGVYHISYCKLTSDYGRDEHYLYATSNYNKQSSISFDNFVIAYKED